MVKMQMDVSKRVVLLENLVAMCARVSGSVCRRFLVYHVSPNRVKVSYSNENEYGTPNPMIASFPCYPSGTGAWSKEGRENPCVVLDLLNVINDTWGGEGWQAFQVLLDCPVLWRDPVDGTWKTREEIEAAKATV